MKPEILQINVHRHLFIYNEPQLTWCTSGNRNFFCIPTTTKRPNYQGIAVSIPKQLLKDYFLSRRDLRSLFTHNNSSNIYRYKGSLWDEQVTLEQQREVFLDDEIPNGQFFATDHTCTDNEYISAPSGFSKILVDGYWETEEFGQMVRRMRDLYAYAWAAKTSKQQVFSTFENQSFSSGSSYTHFFNELSSNNYQESKFRTTAVQYASPGSIQLAGNKDYFESIRYFIEHYQEQKPFIDELYNNLHSILSKEDLLKINTDYTRSKALDERIREKSTELIEKIAPGTSQRIWSLCNDAPVKFAKVSLALKRRVKGAAEFFLQGRAFFENN